MQPALLYIIDDDPDDRNLLIEAINDINPSIKCITANNGQEGLLKLTNSRHFPSIIFLDLNMPRINGRQFLTKLKSDPQLRNIPVIIYSTSSDQKEIDELMLLGARDYLVKQWDYSVLKERLYIILSTVSSA